MNTSGEKVSVRVPRTSPVVNQASGPEPLGPEHKEHPPTAHRIICTERQVFSEPGSHAHIVKVGTINHDGWLRLWTTEQVLWAMNNGETFYTKGKTGDQVASVISARCPACGRTFMCSGPDAVADNQLDILPTGKWT